MFHKEIIFALLLSYNVIFVLGNCQQPVACPTTQDKKQQLNICHNVSFAKYCLCLEDAKTSSFVLEFQSYEACVKANKTLANTFSYGAFYCDPTLQIPINHIMLEKVCKLDGIKSALYQEEDFDPCAPPTPSCHRLECVTQSYHHICDNLTRVEEVFKDLEGNERTFTETQQYIMKFNNKTGGKRQCNKTANKLNSNRFLRQFKSTQCTNDCGSPERILSCTLNLEGLKWACNRKNLMRITFEEKYLNESICRDVTKAQRLFFPNDIKFETFTVKYKTRSKNACYSLVDSLTNPTDPNIRAALSLCNCEQTPPQIRGAMNYEALKLVCRKTDPMIASVVQQRNNVQTTTTTEEPNTDAPRIGLIIG